LNSPEILRLLGRAKLTVVRLGEVRLWVRWHAAAGVRWATVKRENGDQEERQ